MLVFYAVFTCFVNGDYYSADFLLRGFARGYYYSADFDACSGPFRRGPVRSVRSGPVVSGRVGFRYNILLIKTFGTGMFDFLRKSIFFTLSFCSAGPGGAGRHGGDI